jgi:hypothetical protein
VVEHDGGSVEILDLDPLHEWGPLLAPATTRAAGELRERLGLALPAQARVIVSGDAATFARFARRRATPWLLGIARPDGGLVVLNGPLLKPGPERNAIGTLRHELAHLAMGTVAEQAGPIPRWFDEGVASWFAGGYTEFGPLDLAPAVTRRELTLAGLTYSFPDDPDGVRVAYAKSQLAIEWLEREQGEGTVAAIGSALAAGMPLVEALPAVTGMDVGELEGELRQATAPHGLFIAVLRRSLSPFLIMALLTVLGFAIRRVRLRRRMRQWEAEEGSGEDDPDPG